LNLQTELANVSGNGTIFSYTMPANTLSATGCITVASQIKTVSAGSGTIVFNLVFGSTVTAFLSQPGAGTGVLSKFMICNAGATNSQKVITDTSASQNNNSGTSTLLGWGSNAVLTSMAEDTTVDTTVAFTVSGVSGGSNSVFPTWWIVY